MTYEEIVLKVRQVYENADAREVFEHIAVQVNIVGEVVGAFYIEVANRAVCVEPYDYHDRDGLVTVDAHVLMDIAEGKINIQAAHEQKLFNIEGNMEKLRLLQKIKSRPVIHKNKKQTSTEKTEAVKPAAEKPVKEKAEADKPVKEKAEADKPVKEKAEADKTVKEKAETDKPVKEKAEADKTVKEKAAAEK